MADMEIDIVSVFPEYFDVLNLSLLGKAQHNGLVEVRTHNLRDWTHDVHQSVDDTPVGGGAGMVMKPEVWAECLDELLGLDPVDDVLGAAADAACVGVADVVDAAGDSLTGPVLEEGNDGSESLAFGSVVAQVLQDSVADREAAAAAEVAAAAEAAAAGETAGERVEETTGQPVGDGMPDHGAQGTVLIFPNPSAPLFTQADATELSTKRHLVFGCGRYEGYDARIPEYYRAQGVDVREYSIGDYVLNGGEVAVSAMIEAITRLMPGFMGNHESIVEESYTGSNALLEHFQYTKPARWRGIDVPAVLLSGDHGKVDRFRRDEALAKTARLRPDLIEALNCHDLDKADRKMLMALGWNVCGNHPRRS